MTTTPNSVEMLGSVATEELLRRGGKHPNTVVLNPWYANPLEDTRGIIHAMSKLSKRGVKETMKFLNARFVQLLKMFIVVFWLTLNVRNYETSYPR